MKNILLIGAALAAISMGVISPAVAQPHYGYGYNEGWRPDWRGGDRRWDYRDRRAERARWERQRRWEERRRWDDQYRWDDRDYRGSTSLYFGF